MRDIILIADDFALTPAVSAGILTLLEHGRLSGTGAMTNRPHWAVFARHLAGREGVARGVHLNLSLGAPLGPMPLLAPAGSWPSLRKLALGALAQRAVRAELSEEIGRQIDAFAQAMGRAPDFVDGHRHVHVLPGVRAALFNALAQRAEPGRRPWLRDPFDTPARIAARGICAAKAQIVAGLAAGFGRAARARGFHVNRGFSGFSDFDPSRSFAADFRRYLIAPGPRHLVMCHPGRVDAELERLDPVVTTRPLELAYFSSEAFPDHLAEAGVRLGRFPDDRPASPGSAP